MSSFNMVSLLFSAWCFIVTFWFVRIMMAGPLSDIGCSLKIRLQHWHHEIFNRRRVQSLWPGAIILMSSGFRAGMSIEEVIRMIRNESPEPLKSYVNDLLGEGDEWIPIEKKIQILFHDDHLAQVKAVVRMFYQGGGDITSELDRCANILSENEKIRAKHTAMTAEGRMTAWIVGLTPVFLFVATHIISPEYMRPLYQSKPGIYLLSLAFILIGCGMFLVGRIARVDI